MAEPKTRIGSRLRVAITAMVEEALTRPEAAQKAGITDHALYCAMRKPHVQAFRAERMEALRTSESSKTFARVAKLADGAISEHVRLQAAIHLGEIDGISAIQKAEIEHRHIGRVPGLTIVLNSPADDLVDVTPAPVRGLGDVVRRQIGGLHGGYVYGDDVPHPALRRRRAPDEPPEAA